jgi:hypothetical protein
MSETKDFFSWGGPTYSELRATPNGECIDIEYTNSLTHFPSNLVEQVLLDQQVIVQLNTVEMPDEFSVIAAPGWEVVTTSPLMVEEWTTAIITVCQMLLG